MSEKKRAAKAMLDCRTGDRMKEVASKGKTATFKRWVARVLRLIWRKRVKHSLMRQSKDRSRNIPIEKGKGVRVKVDTSPKTLFQRRDPKIRANKLCHQLEEMRRQ